MISKCFRDKSDKLNNPDTNCECRMVTELDSHHIFDIKRISSTKKNRKVNSLKYPLQVLTSSKMRLSICSKRVSSLYVRIRKFSKWDKSSNLKLLIEEITSLETQEREFLFSIVKRQKFGISIKTELYSDTRMEELIKSISFNKKSNQDFRKMIIMAFYSKMLKLFASNARNIEEVKSYKNKTIFVRHYFCDYLVNEKNEETVESLIEDIFGYYMSKVSFRNKGRKKGAWNLHYLASILPKSKLLEADLLEYIQNMFFEEMVTNYDKEVERFVTILTKNFNCSEEGFQGEELALLIKKVQGSKKYKFPWDLERCYEAKEYFCKILNEGEYLKSKRGEYKK